MSIKHKNELGLGIYTVPDIALLLGFPRYKVMRYLTKYLDEELIRSEYSDKYSWTIDGKKKAVNFFVLIELYTFLILRDNKYSIQKIMKARNEIAHNLKTPYPFANSKVLHDKKCIYYYFENELVQVGTKQLPLDEVIESFAERIEFSGNDLANRYWPKGKSSSVVVDPGHQFGQPVINGTNINTEVINSMYESGESESVICSLYQLSKKEVHDVVQFYKAAA